MPTIHKGALDKFKDNYGLYVGSKEDPGDSCHRTCTLAYLGYLDQNEFTYCLKLLECPKSPDNYRRSAARGWWSDPDRFSVDQSIALMAGMGTMGRLDKLKPFLWNIAKRGSLMTNTRRNGATKENHGEVYKFEDGKPVKRNYKWKPPGFFGPRDWATALRFFHSPYLHPLWYLIDVLTVLNSLKRRYWPDNDPVNYILRTRIAEHHQPTFWIKLALRIEDTKRVKEGLEYYSNRIGFPYDKIMDHLL